MSQRCIQRRQDCVEAISTSDGRKAVRPQRIQAHLTNRKKMETEGGLKKASRARNIVEGKLRIQGRSDFWWRVEWLHGTQQVNLLHSTID